MATFLLTTLIPGMILHVCGSIDLFMIENGAQVLVLQPAQALGWLPLGLELVMEDEPSELSRMYMQSCK